MHLIIPFEENLIQVVFILQGIRENLFANRYWAFAFQIKLCVLYIIV